MTNQAEILSSFETGADENSQNPHSANPMQLEQ